MKIIDDQFVGSADLQDIAEKLGQGTVADLVLDRCVFAPPSIVAATSARPIVNSVREGSFPGHGVVEKHRHISPDVTERLWGIKCSDVNGPGVYVDDNSTPDFAFGACFTVKREQRWTTLCHIFSDLSKHPRYFSSLVNTVLVPFWLAKLTDHDPVVRQALRWVVRVGYSVCPTCSAAKEPCASCQKPAALQLDEAGARALVARYESVAVKDYEASARTFTRDQRWLAAIAAGAGYSEPFLRPTVPG